MIKCFAENEDSNILLSEADYDLSLDKWSVTRTGTNRPSLTSMRYGEPPAYLHREVAKRKYGSLDRKDWVRFVNQNPFDCRRENIYIINNRQKPDKMDKMDKMDNKSNKH